MRRNIRNAVIACCLVLVGAIGVAAAAGGAIGVAAAAGCDYAYENQYYDAAGNFVGVRGCDCDVGHYKWGFITENVVQYDYGPCNRGY